MSIWARLMSYFASGSNEAPSSRRLSASSETALAASIGAIRSRTGASLRTMRGGTSGPYGRSSIKHPWSAQRGPCSPMERSVIRDRLIPEPHRHPRIARPKPVASSGLRALLLQQCRDGLDAIAGIFRQPGARAFDEKVESMMGDSHDGANRIQDPHWNKGASHEWGSLIPTICVNVWLRQSKPVIPA
jgi:hypothetical protein